MGIYLITFNILLKSMDDISRDRDPPGEKYEKIFHYFTILLSWLPRFKIPSAITMRPITVKNANAAIENKPITPSFKAILLSLLFFFMVCHLVKMV